MSLEFEWIMLSLRLLATAVLYLFVGAAFYLIWYELKQTQRMQATTVTVQDTGHLRRLDANGSPPAEEIYPLHPMTVLGSDPHSTIVLPVEGIAPRHATLSRENGLWWLEDLSHGETRLNNEPLSQPMPLADGDVIAVGPMRFRLETDQS